MSDINISKSNKGRKDLRAEAPAFWKNCLAEGELVHAEELLFGESTPAKPPS